MCYNDNSQRAEYIYERIDIMLGAIIGFGFYMGLVLVPIILGVIVGLAFVDLFLYV